MREREREKLIHSQRDAHVCVCVPGSFVSSFTWIIVLR